MTEERDWQKVVDLDPRGYVELNDHKKIIHGPIERVSIDKNDLVHIKMLWAATIDLAPLGIPKFGSVWQKAEGDDLILPNLLIPFVIEQTPQKGDRIRFGLNLIYIDPIKTNVEIGKIFGT